MRTTEFKQQIEAQGWKARKQRGLEVFDVTDGSDFLFSVTYAELYPLTGISELLAKKLRREYIPPLG